MKVTAALSKKSCKCTAWKNKKRRKKIIMRSLVVDFGDPDEEEPETLHLTAKENLLSAKKHEQELETATETGEIANVTSEQSAADFTDDHKEESTSVGTSTDVRMADDTIDDRKAEDETATDDTSSINSPLLFIYFFC